MKSKKNIQKLVCICLLLLIIGNFIFLIYKNLPQYTKKFYYQDFLNLYNQSQFAANPKNKKIMITDQDLYSFAGSYYLKTCDLASVNIEHPPLGKYFVGLSILLFNNQNIGQIFWAIGFLILLFLLSNKILKNNILALLVVLLFSLEKTFQNQVLYSLIDLPLLLFLTLLFIKLLDFKNNKRQAVFLGFLLGIIGSIKFPSIAILTFLCFVIYLLSTKTKNIWLNSAYILIIALIIYLLSYLPFVVKNPNPLYFVNLQISALKIHLSHLVDYPKLQVFNVLFLNKWLTWWGSKSYVKIDSWNLLWPILTLNFFVNLIGNFKKNLLINLWTLLYLIFLSIRVFFPRYLLLLIPFFYIQLCYNFLYLYKKTIKRFFKIKKV